MNNYQPSKATLAYLTSWLTKSRKRQESKGRTFNLTLQEFLELWGDRRLRKLDQWMTTGMRGAWMHSDNPLGYVLTWTSLAAARAGVMDITTAIVTTRKRSEMLCRMGKGDRHTQEARQRISAAQRGKPKSEDHRRKLSEAQKGKPRGPMSEETKAKIRAAKAARKLAAT